MASYPTAVKSFTTKNAGEKVQAAHVNDLQDEVSALESGLLNGLQHGLTVSTGGLTVSTGNVALGQNLQVAGASTFAGPVTFSSGVTFSVMPTLPPPEAVRVTGSTTNLANGSTAAITWPTQVYAINSSVHSTGTNPERFTPQSTGVFMLHASIQMQQAIANSTGYLQVEVLDSSGTQLAMSVIDGFAGAFSPTVDVYASKHFTAVGGWVRVSAKQASGSTNSLLGGGCWAEFRKV